MQSDISYQIFFNWSFIYSMSTVILVIIILSFRFYDLKINNNLEQQAVLLFKKWFIEFDNTSKNILETRFGLIPESFKLLKNGELPLVVTDYVANGSFASLKANVTLYQEPNYAYFIRNTDLKSGTFEVFVDEHSYNFLSKSTLY